MTDTEPNSVQLNQKWRHVLILIVLTFAMGLPGIASLPVIDRDEARYVQASLQMAETSDLMNIRFQDQARNKKPAGIYWLQTAALKTFSQTDKRQIWVHRLPSILGALLAVLATYWGGAKLIGRDKAFISAALLTACLLFIFEAHIAKTDAVLCGLSACVFGALARLRHTDKAAPSHLPIWIFWLALGASVMIKGPILFALLVFTLSGFHIWEKSLSWARPLLNPFPILVFFIIWLPWAIGIYIVTDGAFFQDSLGQDLGGKLISTQEKHPGPPGYHLVFLWVMMWPANLFLLPALAFATRNLRANKTRIQDINLFKTFQLCLLWILPFWILIECMPTKLPHYSLPLYPAICLMIGASLTEITHHKTFRKIHIANSILFLLGAGIIIGALLYLSFEYGEEGQQFTAFSLAAIITILSIIAVFAFLKNKLKTAIGLVIALSFILTITGYEALLPKFESFNTSARIAAALGDDLPRLSGKKLISAAYTEPSLVYHLGTNIQLGSTANFSHKTALQNGTIILIDSLSAAQSGQIAELEAFANDTAFCVKISDPISGFNYSKGENIQIHIVQKYMCPD